MHQRPTVRPDLTTYLEVRSAETGRAVGRIVDLTTRGMRMITEEELELEAEFHLVIPLDNGPRALEELRYFDLVEAAQPMKKLAPDMEHAMDAATRALAGLIQAFALLALLFFAAWGLGAHRLISPAMILSCRVRIPCMRL